MKFSNDEEKAKEREKNIRALFGDNKEQADKYIKLYKERKGKPFDWFNNDNTLKVAKEEIIKKLDKSIEKIVLTYAMKESVIATINRLINRIKIIEFTSFDDYIEVDKKVKELQEEINNKRQVSINNSIAALNEIIKNATNNLRELKGKNVLNNDPTEASEKKEVEAEASEK